MFSQVSKSSWIRILVVLLVITMVVGVLGSITDGFQDWNLKDKWATEEAAATSGTTGGTGNTTVAAAYVDTASTVFVDGFTV